MINNQKGFLEAPGFVLLMLLGLLLSSQIVVWQWRLHKTREHHRQTLCLKRAMGITAQMVRRINVVNGMLAAGKLGQGIGLFFPGMGWVAALKWEKVKKILMGLQEATFWWAQKEWLSLRQNGCSLPLKWQLSPYDHKGKFKREFDLVVLRKTEESYRIKTPYVTYLATWKLENTLNPKIQWGVQ